MSRSSYDKLNRRYGHLLSDSEVRAGSERLIDRHNNHWANLSRVGSCKRLAETRIAIVGGGFAGVMAAWTLCNLEKKTEVVLFEAGKDVGGRVRSDPDLAAGRVIDVGAELVGANHPTWLALARKLGIGLMTRTGDGHYKLMKLRMPRINRRFAKGPKEDKIDEEQERKIEKEAKDLLNSMKFILKKIGADAQKVGNPLEPWTDKNLEQFDGKSVKQALEKEARLYPDAYKEIKHILENNLVNKIENINYLALLCLVKAGRFDGDLTQDTDLLGFWEHTEDFRCTNGCQALVKKMVQHLSDKENGFRFTLLRDTIVTDIEFDLTGPVKPRPATLKWKPNDDPKAGTRPKAQITKDWQGVKQEFDYVVLAVPPTVWDKIVIAPDDPARIIPFIQTGPAVKFFSVFRDRFWIARGIAPSGTSAEIGMIWEGSDNQTLGPEQEVVLSVFTGFPKSGKPLPESTFTKELARLYPDYQDKLVRKKLQSWPDEPFIRLGYSCPKPGDIFRIGNKLVTPMNGGRLYLAGEHTQTDFFGFMEGALRSGQRVAESIIADVCQRPKQEFIA